MPKSKKLYFFNKTRSKILASEANVADTFLSRLVGLLKTPSLEPGQGLYIAPCSQIHMFGMKYAIDVVFMDKKGTVVGLCNKIQPGQASALYARAHGCVELPAGTIDESQTQVGDEIESSSSEL